MHPDIEYFLKKLGAPMVSEPVPKEVLARYHGIFPDAFVDMWQSEGFCGYWEGLYWTVNPDDYQGYIERWLEGSPYEGHQCYVYARTAFGIFYFYNATLKRAESINPVFHSFRVFKSALEEVDGNFEFDFLIRLSGFRKESFDSLEYFNAALEKFGPLNANEIYGFQPFIALAGDAPFENLDKLDLFVYFELMHQMGIKTQFGVYD